MQRNFSIRVFKQCLRILIIGSMLMMQFASEVKPVSADIVLSFGMVVQDVQDQGFGQSAYAGLVEASQYYGQLDTLYETPDPNNFEARLNQCASEGNHLCFAVGSDMASAVVAAANSNPATDFSILDYRAETLPANVASILFNEKQQDTWQARWPAG